MLKFVLYIDGMCVNIVVDFGLLFECVNVKVKINEKFGYFGCGEGIEV